ncbi:uncharacterized protein M421DRAFT_264995 [Didymella exigua CBS 183.55]|uniref:Uncharacterized protein n=1 Tax=Didymella exigua CBS 183.55 TaxID=1150837 RepID=A0A6A5RD20_9PLEO|nr:uncharacterized protein M421DRAFT_264995 [Didymella exigua CBS 183.55]KAF1925108.1 hypothetical protein M421DRAFT_264995 [Didymella exigua CBS 183.55]
MRIHPLRREPSLRSLQQSEILTGSRLGMLASQGPVSESNGTARCQMTLRRTGCPRSQSQAGNATIPRIWICGKWDLTSGKISCSGDTGLQGTIRPTLFYLVPLIAQCGRNVRHSIQYHGAQVDQCVLNWGNQHHDHIKHVRVGVRYEHVSYTPAAWDLLQSDRWTGILHKRRAHQ